MPTFYPGQTDYIQQLNRLDAIATAQKGETGSTGPVGPSTNLTIGTVTGGASAAATVTGVSPNQVLNLTLPKGDTGSQGIQGIQGLRGLTARGAWSAATAYAVDDFVTNAGSSYRRKVAGTTATVPGSDTTNWEVLAAKGVDGAGSVSSVAGVGPAVGGNVPLTPQNLGLHPLTVMTASTSLRNFTNGVLVQTSIPYESSGNGIAWLLKVTGNSYSTATNTNAACPYDYTAQGYVYISSVIAAGSISLGQRIPNVQTLRYNGMLCFWWPAQNYFAGYTVHASIVNGTGSELNYVTSVTDSGLVGDLAAYISERNNDFRSAIRSMDYNYATENGVYRVDPGSTNVPAIYGNLLTLRGGGADTITQIFGQYSTGDLYTRSGNPVQTGGAGAYSAWNLILTQSNFGSYVPSKTGVGASGTWNIDVYGSSGSSRFIKVIDGDRTIDNVLPATSPNTVRWDFMESVGTGMSGAYCGAQTITPYAGTSVSGGGSSYQVVYGGGNPAGALPEMRIRKGIDGAWQAWHAIIHSGNVTDYAVPNTFLAGRSTSDANAPPTVAGITAYYLTSSAANRPPGVGSDFSLLTLAYSAAYNTQIAGDWRTGQFYCRASSAENGVLAWRKMFHEGNTVPVANGGTGATTAVAARAALGITDAVEALYNKTLVRPLLAGYSERVSVPSAAASFTLDLSLDTIHVLNTTGNLTVALPAAETGRSFTVLVIFGGAHTVSFTGGTAIKWAGGAPPTPTSVAGKTDIYTFMQVGSITYGQDGGRNF